jgi:tetratricopeptide (TPR) repeat protein
VNPQAAAEATYQIGEVRRFRGELTGAEQSYLTAHRLGRDPQPGLALLRLAQGRSDAARSAVRAALAAESGDRLRRSRLLVAAVEIELAAGDIAAATAASDELAAIAATYASSGLVAAARQAAGAVLLAGGRPQEALPLLRDAGRRWREIDAPYLAARVGVLLARAYGWATRTPRRGRRTPLAPSSPNSAPPWTQRTWPHCAAGHSCPVA